MNKFIGIGNITKPLELKYTASSKAVASFTIAINGYNDTTDFINCVVWDKQAENLVKYCSKGSKVAVEGRLSTRSYDDKDGKRVYITEITATNIEFLNSKEESKEDMPQEVYAEQQEDPFSEFGKENQEQLLDLPF